MGLPKHRRCLVLRRHVDTVLLSNWILTRSCDMSKQDYGLGKVTEGEMYILSERFDQRLPFWVHWSTVFWGFFSLPCWNSFILEWNTHEFATCWNSINLWKKYSQVVKRILLGRCRIFTGPVLRYFFINRPWLSRAYNSAMFVWFESDVWSSRWLVRELYDLV